MDRAKTRLPFRRGLLSPGPRPPVSSPSAPPPAASNGQPRSASKHSPLADSGLLAPGALPSARRAFYTLAWTRPPGPPSRLAPTPRSSPRQPAWTPAQPAPTSNRRAGASRSRGRRRGTRRSPLRPRLATGAPPPWRPFQRRAASPARPPRSPLAATRPLGRTGSAVPPLSNDRVELQGRRRSGRRLLRLELRQLGRQLVALLLRLCQLAAEAVQLSFGLGHQARRLRLQLPPRLAQLRTDRLQRLLLLVRQLRQLDVLLLHPRGERLAHLLGRLHLARLGGQLRRLALLELHQLGLQRGPVRRQLLALLRRAIPLADQEQSAPRLGNQLRAQRLHPLRQLRRLLLRLRHLRGNYLQRLVRAALLLRHVRSQRLALRLLLLQFDGRRVELHGCRRLRRLLLRQFRAQRLALALRRSQLAGGHLQLRRRRLCRRSLSRPELRQLGRQPVALLLCLRQLAAETVQLGFGLRPLLGQVAGDALGASRLELNLRLELLRLCGQRELLRLLELLSALQLREPRGHGVPLQGSNRFGRRLLRLHLRHLGLQLVAVLNCPGQLLAEPVRLGGSRGRLFGGLRCASLRAAELRSGRSQRLVRSALLLRHLRSQRLALRLLLLQSSGRCVELHGCGRFGSGLLQLELRNLCGKRILLLFSLR
eukprot:1179563-Prorocentrum_minimum.AAC.1